MRYPSELIPRAARFAHLRLLLGLLVLSGTVHSVPHNYASPFSPFLACSVWRVEAILPALNQDRGKDLRRNGGELYIAEDVLQAVPCWVLQVRTSRTNETNSS